MPLSIVLVQPEIPGNTGAVGRTCVALDAELVLIHPLHDASANRAVGTMALEARHHHELGPASLSPDLFWWRPGEVEHVPTSFDGVTVHVTPSEALLDVLAHLAPEPSEPPEPPRGVST